MRELPWKYLTGVKFQAQEYKVRKSYVKAGGWILALLLILCGILTKYKVALIFGLLYLITMMTEKEQVVTERGLEVFYDMKITTQYDLWTWDEINSIVEEDAHHQRLVRLHIGKGNKEKAIFFTREDAGEIIKLAKKSNPSIKVIKTNKTSRKAKRK